MCSKNCPCEASPNSAEWTGTNNEFGRTRFNFSAAPGEGYSTFKDCWEALLAGERDGATDDQVAEAKAKAEDASYDAGVKFFEYFEGLFECSGMCKTGLFYYSRPISDGRPPKTCMTYLKDEISNNLTYLGICTFFSSIGVFCAFTGQYLLWKKYDD
jgi:hypothetical protein